MKHIACKLETPKITLNNRLVLPPMDFGTCDADGHITEKTLAHYDKKTKVAIFPW